MEIHVYLAGPDVFFPDAIARGEAKKAILAKAGMIGHFPFDNQIPPQATPTDTAYAIARANERMMLDCCATGRIGIILANMTPYHGPSMDVGTGFEVGFMSALAAIQPNVIIIGYSDDSRTFEERVITSVYGGRDHTTEKEGILYGNDGKMIETFSQADNLMITHAIAKTGGRVVNHFDEAVVLAETLIDVRDNNIQRK